MPNAAAAPETPIVSAIFFALFVYVSCFEGWVVQQRQLRPLLGSSCDCLGILIQTYVVQLFNVYGMDLFGVLVKVQLPYFLNQPAKVGSTKAQQSSNLSQGYYLARGLQMLSSLATASSSGPRHWSNAYPRCASNKISNVFYR